MATALTTACVDLSADGDRSFTVIIGYGHGGLIASIAAFERGLAQVAAAMNEWVRAAAAAAEALIDEVLDASADWDERLLDRPSWLGCPRTRPSKREVTRRPIVARRRRRSPAARRRKVVRPPRNPGRPG